MENLFEISKRAGEGKCHLADLVTELGVSCEKNQADSNRVCAHDRTENVGTVSTFRCPIQSLREVF